MKTYRIKDWDRVFENHRSRELKSLDYVSWPVRSKSEAFQFLMRSPEGVLAFGVFSAIVSEAARCPARGVLADEKGPITVRRLAVRLGTPEALLEAAVNLLTSEDVGWLEEVDDEGDTDASEASETTERTSPAPRPRDRREIAAGSRDAAATSTRDSAPRPVLSNPIHSGSREQLPIQHPSGRQAESAHAPSSRSAPTNCLPAVDSLKRVCSLLLALKDPYGLPVFTPKDAAAIAKEPNASIVKASWAVDRYREEIATEEGRKKLIKPGGWIRSLIRDGDMPQGYAVRFNRAELARISSQQTPATDKGAA